MTRKTIKLDGDRELALTANGATLIIYREVFHEDLLTALAKSREDEMEPTETATMMARLAYVMNRQAEGNTEKLGKQDFYDWLSAFGTVEIFNFMTEVLNVWNENAQGTSTPKN